MTGDANGVNSQGGRAPRQDVAGPAQVASSDITRLEFRRKDDGRTVTGIVATLTLAAAPARATAYYFRLGTADCANLNISYLLYQDGTTESVLSDNCGGGENQIDVRAEVKGTSIVFDIPRRELPVRLGTELTKITADTRVMAGSNPEIAVHPAVTDELITDLRWKLGS